MGNKSISDGVTFSYKKIISCYNYSRIFIKKYYVFNILKLLCAVKNRIEKLQILPDILA